MGYSESREVSVESRQEDVVVAEQHVMVNFSGI